jgi:hypothetical protein
MKKLLVLMLVLGMASLAPAALQISVNGNPDPIDSEIILDAPSGELILDIHGVTAGAGDIPNWMIVVDSALGSVDASNVIFNSSADVKGIFDQYYVDYYFLSYIGQLGSSARAGWVGSTGGALDGMLVDNILFHCEAPGDAIVLLFSSYDAG